MLAFVKQWLGQYDVLTRRAGAGGDTKLSLQTSRCKSMLMKTKYGETGGTGKRPKWDRLLDPDRNLAIRQQSGCQCCRDCPVEGGGSVWPCLTATIVHIATNCIGSSASAGTRKALAPARTPWPISLSKTPAY